MHDLRNEKSLTKTKNITTNQTELKNIGNEMWKKKKKTQKLNESEQAKWGRKHISELEERALKITTPE